MNIVITGASRGIGRAIALEFGKEGNHNFFLICKNDVADLFDLSDKLQYLNNEVIIRKLDVTDRNAIRTEINMLTTIHPKFKVDVLINNAGILRDRTLMKMTDEEWDEVIDTNLTGVFNITKAFLPLFNPLGGSIINMSSVIGTLGNFGQTNYSASKAGIIAFSKSLAKELANREIRVNAVSPSLVDTSIYDNVSEEQQIKLMDRTVMKRMATAKEIAKFVVFLCKDGTFCTGQNYTIDGGFT